MVIRQILHYLMRHPDAKDTMTGILRWWLPREGVERKEEEVQEALDTLVARGWVTTRQTTPSQSLYWLNQEKLEEIKAFLRELEGAAEGPQE